MRFYHVHHWIIVLSLGKKSLFCNSFSKYTPLALGHNSASPSYNKGMIINLLLPLIFYEQQHFNQSSIPSLACVWEGACSLCTTSTPCRQQWFVCVYCSGIFSQSHQALWVFQKFARFSHEKQMFQMSIDADFNWLTDSTKNMCKEADDLRGRLVYKVWQTSRLVWKCDL